MLQLILSVIKRCIAITVLMHCASLSHAQSFTEIDLLTGINEQEMDFFGIATDISGNYAVVGADDHQNEFESDSLTDAGAVYVYEREANNSWSFVQKLVPADRSEFDVFGRSVSISGDYILVGSHSSWGIDAITGDSIDGAGAAYLFERQNNGVWEEVQKITASDQSYTDRFGYAVKIHGSFAFIHSEFEAVDPNTGETHESGEVHVFKKSASSGGQFVEVQRLRAETVYQNAGFGDSAICASDSILVLGSQESYDENESNYLAQAGAAYVYHLSDTATFIQKVVDPVRSELDQFGIDVSLSGNYLAISAWHEDRDESELNSMDEAGAVYLYERDSTATFQFTQKIVASDRQVGDEFGISVSISGDKLVIGSRSSFDEFGQDPVNEAGAAYVFERSNCGQWIEEEKLVASDRWMWASFGQSVGISGDFILIGSWRRSEILGGYPTIFQAGAAYLFELDSSLSSTNYIETCDAYVPPSGNGVYTESGTYVDIVPDSFGCDSTIVIQLTVIDLDTSLTLSDSQLLASPAADAYQWYDCDTGLPLIGQTSATLDYVNDGLFYVEMEYGGCSFVSECAGFTALADYTTEEVLTIYPMPTEGMLTVSSSLDMTGATIFIFDMTGKMVHSDRSISGKVEQLDLSSLGSGQYLLSVINDTWQGRARLTITK